MKTSSLVLPAVVAAAVSLNAFAATTGTINFQGTVINATCQIAAGSENQTITLPQVVASDFTAANQARGQVVPFQIILTGCDASVPGNVDIIFNFNPDTGFDDIIENTGTAQGVGVRISDDQGKVIAMIPGEFYTSPQALATGDVVFNLEAEYVSTTATVTAGTVNATATIEVGYP